MVVLVLVADDILNFFSERRFSQCAFGVWSRSLNEKWCRLKHLKMEN